MRYFKIDRSLRVACGFVLLAGAAAFADPSPSAGNPDTNASDKNFDTNQPNTIGGAAQKTEDGANRALNKVDNGVHKVAGKSKKAGKKAKKATSEAASDVKESANTKIEPETSTPSH
jgi:hypothetical protein